VAKWHMIQNMDFIKIYNSIWSTSWCCI